MDVLLQGHRRRGHNDNKQYGHVDRLGALLMAIGKQVNLIFPLFSFRGFGFGTKFNAAAVEWDWIRQLGKEELKFNPPPSVPGTATI